MLDLNGLSVVKLVDMQGKRVGALVDGHIFDGNGIKKLAQHLSATGQKLANATITSDGRIMPTNNGAVNEWTYSEIIPDGFGHTQGDSWNPAPRGLFWVNNKKLRNDPAFKQMLVPVNSYVQAKSACDPAQQNEAKDIHAIMKSQNDTVKNFSDEDLIKILEKALHTTIPSIEAETGNKVKVCGKMPSAPSRVCELDEYSIAAPTGFYWVRDSEYQGYKHNMLVMLPELAKRATEIKDRVRSEPPQPQKINAILIAKPYKRRDGFGMFYVNGSNGASLGIAEKVFASKMTKGQKNAWKQFEELFEKYAIPFTGDVSRHTEDRYDLDFDCTMLITDVCCIGGMEVHSDGAYLVKDNKIVKLGSY